MNYLNCFWYSFLVISTIGYGEIVAFSFLGKLFTNILAFWGIFFISIFVVFNLDLFILSKEVKLAIDLIENLERKTILKKYATLRI